MREKAKKIIEDGIFKMPILFDKRDAVAEFAVKAMAGEIAMAMRLDLITIDEMEEYMCLLHENFSKLPKHWEK